MVVKKPKFEYWESDKNNQWYWRLVDSNGKIIAIGAQPFNSKPIVQEAIRNLYATVPYATDMYDIS